MGVSRLDIGQRSRVLPQQSRTLRGCAMLRMLHDMRAATLMLALMMLAGLLAAMLAYFDVLIA